VKNDIKKLKYKFSKPNISLVQFDLENNNENAAKILIYSSTEILQHTILIKPSVKSRHCKIMLVSIHKFGQKALPMNIG
jgi:hypothetical protein